jgi:hypothetical protein
MSTSRPLPDVAVLEKLSLGQLPRAIRRGSIISSFGSAAGGVQGEGEPAEFAAGL